VAAASQAGPIDDTIVLVHWLMLVLFLAWGIFFLYVLIRFRRGAHPAASYDGMKGTWTRWLEGGILVAEIVLLAFYSIPAWSVRVNAFPAERESTVIRVVASSTRGMSTTPAATASSGGPSCASSVPIIHWASIRMIRHRATT
jgi:heme/copper-type cytochrome/quinol oxidase subunit 2